MTFWVIAAISGWVIVAALCVVIWDLDKKVVQERRRTVQAFTDEPLVEADIVPELCFGMLGLNDGKFRVVQTTADGRRARMMLERGTPGQNETLALYDGPHLRGQKQGATA